MVTSNSRTGDGVLHWAASDPAYGAFLLLRVGFTALPILMGLDKFTNFLSTGRFTSPRGSST